jgi:magnesium transporter
MLSNYKHKKIIWMDLESPTVDEVKSIMNKYSIHSFVADELLQPTIKSKVDVYEDIIFLVLHFPVFNLSKMEYDSCEIDFVLGKDFLITTHYGTIIPLYEIAKIFEAEGIISEKITMKNSGVLFFYIIKQLYEFSWNQLDRFQYNIEKIREKMFEKKGSLYDLTRRISHIRKDAIDFRRIIYFHKEMFASLEHSALKLFGKDYLHYLNNINGEFLKVWNLMDSHCETIESFQETMDSLLSHRSNEIMKILTIMAFITFPLLFLANLFSMNTKILPIVGMQGDFWIILGLMILTTIGMFFFFMNKKWL